MPRPALSLSRVTVARSADSADPEACDCRSPAQRGAPGSRPPLRMVRSEWKPE